MNNYEQNLDKNDANFVPLTPLTFLERAKDIYPNYEALVYENRSYTWSDVYRRCTKFASALEKIGIGLGDTVSVMAMNTPEIFEAHYSVPMTGAILNTINVRLDAKTVQYILEHSEAKVFIVDRQFHSVISKVMEQLKNKPIIIDIQDDFADQSLLKKIGEHEYEDFLNTGDDNYIWKRPKDEWQAISLNYTSGTTGNPKGVVYHHRGSYLMSTGSAVAWNMPNRLSFLTIVPMFHCNGWGYPWTIPMLNGKTVCLRNIDVKKIFELIIKHKVTHFGGAPIVLNMITGASEKDRKKLEHKVYVLTAGAPPPSIIFKKMEALGFEVMHVYGLTETYGHVSQCAWNDEWNSLDEDKKNEIKARQGVRYPNTEDIKVMNPENMEPVPQDGKTMGEIMIRGNVVMKGYFKDKAATDKAMNGGWFHSGDLAVAHPDGYIKIQDRSKDIIISGGENISSIEIENTLSKHPAVSIAAVVAKPDEKWGEVPAAFIEKVKDKDVTDKELMDFCRETLAGFKIPKYIEFCELPKTSTGKIQKFELRKKF
ncbi:acyl-CoA synthetase [Candidatus Pelagibacter sp.]|jgi:fatty-acyl-CoA synthase|uniref:acyl-CoA synthetase n=1 Tax=Candidatus Pelagibacter sp. TaxID=2024849 RepID=UPI00027E4D02|nr:AMP-binding enzyme [alpha proteobacterium HIMB5]REK50799.1 MAG: acyl-CoA synthetase [Pseudomonadota bacterium]|tara:strand:+ start:116 stop:1732 length:1617 start_codon:yes stop_codon:yes gene_type:complete